MAEGLEWDRVDQPKQRSKPSRFYKRNRNAASSLENDFQILEFLILTTMLRGELFCAQVLSELQKLPAAIELPKHGVIYMRLKDLVRDGYLASRKEGGAPKVYFSLTPRGIERVNAMRALTQSLNAVSQAEPATLPS